MMFDKIKIYFKNNWFRYVLIGIVFGLHCAVYWITPLFIPKTLIDMPEWLIMPFEKNIPMIPAFMIFYFGCFAWWVIAFLLAKSDRVYTQFFVFFPCYLICAICFVIFPFKIEWSEITGTGFFYDMVRFLRVIDKPEKLFPSIHVLVTICAYLALAFDKRVKLWARITGFVFVLGVWFSTLTLEQHYFVDGLAAIFIAVLFTLIFHYTHANKLIFRWEECWTKKKNDE